jgi:hypothetical protein
VPLVAILGDAVPEQVAERMGLRQAPQPTERFLGGVLDWSQYIEWRRGRGRPLSPDTDDKAVSRRLDTEFFATTQRPWSATDYPLVAGWLEDMKSPLEAVDQATIRPHHWIPITRPLFTSFIPAWPSAGTWRTLFGRAPCFDCQKGLRMEPLETS